MGKVIQFPGNNHSERSGICSAEKAEVISLAQDIFSVAIKEATVLTGSLEHGPTLARQIEEGGEWSAEKLESYTDDGPNLTVV